MNPILSAVVALLVTAGIFTYWRVKQLKTENQKLASEAVRYQKLQELFLTNMSHELRTPITALQGFTDLMLSWVKDEHLSARYLEALVTMKRNELSLLDTINSILTFSKLKSQVFVPIHIETVIVRDFFNEVIENFRFEAREKNIYLKLEFSEKVPVSFSAQTQSLRQVLTHLLQNAFKFTLSGGVVVQVDYIDSAEKNMGNLMIDVIDTGIGIDAKDKEKIFEPFFQSESAPTRSFGGTGLGLPISRLLAEQMHGKINVESKPSQGSKFSLIIPVRVVSAALSMDEQPRGKKVMVAEDAEDSRVIISMFLEPFKPQLTVVENGREVVRSVLEAEKTAEPYDLVLMDIQMPIMDGYQATRLLRHRGFKKPIIAVTSHNIQGDREKCLAAGCTDYIPKPLDFRSFAEKMKQFLLPPINSTRESINTSGAAAPL